MAATATPPPLKRARQYGLLKPPEPKLAPRRATCRCGETVLLARTPDRELFVLEPGEVVPRMPCPECAHRRKAASCPRCDLARWIGDTLPKSGDGAWLYANGWARHMPVNKARHVRAGSLNRPPGVAAHRFHVCRAGAATSSAANGPLFTDAPT